MQIDHPAAAPDLQFYNLGPFAACYPQTEAGQDWMAENLGTPGEPGDDQTWLGNGLAIEHPYLSDIVDGARAAGLVCHG